jgi:translation initiation factor IF-2
MSDISFSVNDLKAVLHIITVVSSRGAIKPDEMVTVGELYSRIATFVNAAEQASRKPVESVDASLIGDS